MKRLNIDERYSKMRYTIIPHNATSVDAFAASPLSTDAHVKTIQTLLQESNERTNMAAVSSSSSSSNNDAGVATKFSPMKLVPTTVYRVHCEADDAKYEPFDVLPFQQKMWYGIRKCELGGVLSHGIPFPTAESPVSSFPYGKCIQLSTSPMAAAQRCMDFEPLVEKNDGEEDKDGEDEEEDEEEKEEKEEGRSILLGMCTVACGNMYSADGRPSVFFKPPTSCHSIKVDHEMGTDVMIYDIGQLRLDSIVVVQAVGGSERKMKETGQTSLDLVDEIMAEAAGGQVIETSEGGVVVGVMEVASKDGETVVVEKERVSNSVLDVAVSATDAVEQEKMVMSLDAVALKEAQHTASTSTTSMDMANEILAEVGMMASP